MTTVSVSEASIDPARRRRHHVGLALAGVLALAAAFWLGAEWEGVRRP